MSADPQEIVSFDEALALRGDERRFKALVHPSWDGPLTTHGGLLAAVALRAIDRVINRDNDKQARSLTCHYLRPPRHGDIEIDVDPLRSGRRFASARAMISQGGRACVAILGTHSVRDLEEVETPWNVAMPEVAPAPPRDASHAAAPDYRVDGEHWLELHPKAPQFFRRQLIAPRFGAAPFMGEPHDALTGTENGGWVTLPDPRPVDAAWLAFLVDAFWPSVLQPMRTPAVAPTLDLTIHFRQVLPPDGLPDQPLLVHNTTASLLSGLSDSDSRVYAADGRLLAIGRQHALVMPYSRVDV